MRTDQWQLMGEPFFYKGIRVGVFRMSLREEAVLKGHETKGRFFLFSLVLLFFLLLGGEWHWAYTGHKTLTVLFFVLLI